MSTPVSPTPNPPAHAATRDDAAPDPFSRLAHMSTTAGLGSTDYVAVSWVAVLAAVLGIGGSVALIHPLLLVIPVLGVFAAVVALFQISNSAGTQTGKGIAIFGLLAAGTFAGVVLYRTVSTTLEEFRDTAAVRSVVTQLNTAMVKEDYASAYALYTDRFKEQFTEKDFADFWQTVTSNEAVGKVTDVEWRGLMRISPAKPGQSLRLADTVLLYRFEKTYVSPDTVLERTDGVWRINAQPGFLEKPDAKGAGAK